MTLIVGQMAQFANYVLSFRVTETLSEEACLVLHGFPAETPIRPEYEKNKDIAAEIARAVNMDVYLPHYRGLGKSPGPFSFHRTIVDSFELAKKLLSDFKYRTVHIVGHSWGALVAMNLAKDLGDFGGKLILLSPFNVIPSDDILRRVLSQICDGLAIEFEKGGIEGAVQEIREIANARNPRFIAGSLKTKKNQVTIIQALQDDEVPVSSTREFVSLFPTRPEYIEFDSDHKFSLNREALISLIIARLKGKNRV